MSEEVLEHDVTAVDIFEDVAPDDCMQVGLHEVEYQIDILMIARPDNAVQIDDVGMAPEFAEEHDFAVGALGIGSVLEGIEDFLEGDCLLGFLVDGLPDHSVGSLAQLLEDLVLLEDVGL